MKDLVKHIAFHVPRIVKGSGVDFAYAWDDIKDILPLVGSLIKHVISAIVGLIVLPFSLLIAIGLYVFVPVWRRGVKDRNIVREARKDG